MVIWDIGQPRSVPVISRWQCRLWRWRAGYRRLRWKTVWFALKLLQLFLFLSSYPPVTDLTILFNISRSRQIRANQSPRSLFSELTLCFWLPSGFLMAAWAAASRAIGTRERLNSDIGQVILVTKFDEAGSPPCSPQIPTLRFDLVARPFSTAL